MRQHIPEQHKAGGIKKIIGLPVGTPPICLARLRYLTYRSSCSTSFVDNATARPMSEAAKFTKLNSADGSSYPPRMPWDRSDRIKQAPS